MEQKWQRPWSSSIVSMLLRNQCMDPLPYTGFCHHLSFIICGHGYTWHRTDTSYSSGTQLCMAAILTQHQQTDRTPTVGQSCMASPECAAVTKLRAINLLAGYSHMFFRWKNFILEGWDNFLRNIGILSGGAQFTLPCLLCGLHLWLILCTISSLDLCRVQFFFALCVTFWSRFI